MRQTHDVFALWSSTAEMATAISAKPDTVRKWKKYGRIPQDAWPEVIVAAALKGVELTTDDIIAFNTPMKPRGRPAHKRRLRKRIEALAV